MFCVVLFGFFLRERLGGGGGMKQLDQKFRSSGLVGRITTRGQGTPEAPPKFVVKLFGRT